ncbi:MAG: class II aldolase/adducin family protein [Solirubrobacterales bacterium]
MSTVGQRASAVAGQVASVARILSRAGLVEAFGHVSARCEEGFAITSTAPLGEARSAEVAICDVAGEARGEAGGLPLETPLHAAVYSVRAEVGAICRTHSRAAVLLGARGQAPPVLHGLGGLAGDVRTYDCAELITDRALAERCAGALGPADCLLIRANGAIAVGADLPEALVRAYYLEERCAVALDSPGVSGVSEAELASRSRWFAAERERAHRWLRRRYGDAEEPGQENGNEGEEPVR